MTDKELLEAFARPSEDITQQLKYIHAYGDCPNCKKFVEGKIKINEGYLIGKLYDILPEEDNQINIGEI